MEINKSNELLCEYIIERDPSEEISRELKKLFTKGANINYRDQSLNTPIHLAVANNDIRCVEFLLRRKPELTLKNGDHKTPLALATKLNGGEVLKLLTRHKNRRFEYISHNSIYEFVCSKKHEISFSAKQSNFKILRIVKCPRASEAFEILNQKGIRKVLESATHLFIIIIETNEDSDISAENAEILQKVFGQRRPLVVQITSEEHKCSNILYKASKSKDVIKVELEESIITTETLLERLKTKSTCNIQTLLHGLKSNTFGSFNGNILETKLNRDDKNLEQVIKLVAKHDPLCLRFLKLFEESSTESSEKAPMFESLAYVNEESLSALLDLPFDVHKHEQMNMNPRLNNHLEVIDENRKNLVEVAIEIGNIDAFRLLVKKKNMLCIQKPIADYLYKNELYEYLIELLKADSRFPSSFDIAKIDENDFLFEELKEIIYQRNKFHKAINSGSIGDVISLMKETSQLRIAFNLENKSALMTALDAKQFEIYSFLRSQGFLLGFQETIEDLSNSDKRKIRDSNKKYFTKYKNSALNFLMSRTRLALKHQEEFYEIIRNMYEQLNENEEIQPILGTIENTDELDIVFDFNKEHVADMDATKSDWTRGTTYSNKGTILIGAGNHETNFREIIGTLAHELTHYAMQLIYGRYLLELVLIHID
jgi:ankyrin repeat protein